MPGFFGGAIIYLGHRFSKSDTSGLRLLLNSGYSKGRVEARIGSASDGLGGVDSGCFLFLQVETCLP